MHPKKAKLKNAHAFLTLMVKVTVYTVYIHPLGPDNLPPRMLRGVSINIFVLIEQRNTLQTLAESEASVLSFPSCREIVRALQTEGWGVEYVQLSASRRSSVHSVDIGERRETPETDVRPRRETWDVWGKTLDKSDLNFSPYGPKLCVSQRWVRAEFILNIVK